jgi:hypothetical protein
LSEAWDEIEQHKKHKRHDGWLVVVSVGGEIHAIPPDRTEALDEDGNRRTFDSVAAAKDFVDQHHPSGKTEE